MPNGPIEPGLAPNAASISSAVAGRSSCRSAFLQLQLVQPAVSSHQREHDVAVLRHHRHRLAGRARIDAQERASESIVVGARGLDLLRGARRGRGPRCGPGHLDVGGIAAAACSSATRFSAAVEGAMYSWARLPPVSPLSDSTFQ